MIFHLGVELEGSDEQPFTDAQYARLNELIQALRAAYPMLVDLAGHSDIAPGRKTDPGPYFRLETRCLAPAGLIRPLAPECARRCA